MPTKFDYNDLLLLVFLLDLNVAFHRHIEICNVKVDILVKTILNFVIIPIATPIFVLFYGELGMRTNLGRLGQDCSTLRCILLKVIYIQGIIYLRL